MIVSFSKVVYVGGVGPIVGTVTRFSVTETTKTEVAPFPRGRACGL